VQAWQVPETQTRGDVHCELVVHVPHAPEAQTCPVGQSPLPAQGPQLPEAEQTSPVAHSVPVVHDPHTPAMQA
jgi:hypothetical protein